MDKHNKEMVLGAKNRAKLEINESIKMILEKYNKEWVKNELDVNGELMSDYDWLIYSHLCNARDALRNIEVSIVNE